MRCVGCNECLTDSERRTRNRVTGEFDDMCYSCRSNTHSGIGYNQHGTLAVIDNGTKIDKEYVGGDRGQSESSMVSIIMQKGYLQMD